MLSAAIVPEGECVGLPFDVAIQSWSFCNMLEQAIEEHFALPRCQTLDVMGEATVDVQHLFTGLWVSGD